MTAKIKGKVHTRSKPLKKIFSTKISLTDGMGLTTNNTNSRWRIRYKQRILVKRHNKHDNQTNSRYAAMHARSIVPHQVIWQ